MKASEFIQMCKDSAGQNLSNTQYGDSQWLFFIKWGLDYIFSYLNLRGTRSYSAYEETVVPVNKIATTTYKMHGLIVTPFFGEDNYDDSDTWVKATDGTKLQGVNFFPEPESNQFAMTWDTSGITGLVLWKDWDSIRIRYKCAPTYPQAGQLTDLLDIPENLEVVLFNLVLRQAKPVYLENGVNLANAYKQFADDLLDNYAQNASQWFMTKMSA